MAIIDDFAKFSGLGVNQNKTVIIKSSAFTTADREFFRHGGTRWSKVVLAEDHVYLGILFGRQVDTVRVYKDALTKFTKRIASHRQVILSRSVDHRIIIVNVFLTSIFSYLMQFFILPWKEVVKKVRDMIRKVVISFNGGAFAYVHLVTPTDEFGFKQPLRDLWAAGVAALASKVDLMSFNGMEHPPLLPDKPYLDVARTWSSMLISDHRDAAALDLLHQNHASNAEGRVQVQYEGPAKSRKIYMAAVSDGYRDEVLSESRPTSLTSRLHLRWGLSGLSSAKALRENARDIGKWMPAYIRSNHIKLVFNALATDDKLERHGGKGPPDRRQAGFPCYLCGGGRDSLEHIYLRCEVTNYARHYFHHFIGYHPGLRDCSANTMAVGAFPSNEGEPRLINATLVFNHAVWDHRTVFFKAVPEPPSRDRAALRIAQLGFTLWNKLAPKKWRASPLRSRFQFLSPMPRNRRVIEPVQEDPVAVGDQT